MNKFEIYKSEDGREHSLHIIEYDEYVIFKANDIGKILGLSYITKQISSFDDTERKTVLINDNSFYFLTDIGAYTVLGSSRKMNAKQLMRWINNYVKDFEKKKKLKNETNIEKNCDNKIDDDDIYVAYIFKFTDNSNEVKYLIKATKNWSKKIRFFEEVFPKGKLLFWLGFNKNQIDYKKYIEYIKFCLNEYYISEIYDHYINVDYVKKILALPIIWTDFANAENKKELKYVLDNEIFKEIRDDFLDY